MKIISRYIFFILLSYFLLLAGCKSEKNEKAADPAAKPVQKQVSEKRFRLIRPQRNTLIAPGEKVQLRLETLSENVFPDSVRFFLKGDLVKTTSGNSLESELMIPDLPPGSANLRLMVYAGGLEENYSVNLKITSGIEAEKYGYQIIKSYPHDKGAFTQGLEFYKGFLYEGTGNYGESSLRKVELETGEVLKYRSLDSDLFGEGITIINNKIYQITYREQVGFVYDEKSFELLRKIYYQIKEGWGMTNDGEHILMSDGSHYIYFMDTTYFSEVKKIEVYDHKGEVDLLNELELIDGVLYANRYTTEEIVMIDPETGRVIGRIDMSGILDPSDRHPSIDYFNGIAYDKENDRIFVTGKYWPRVYQVKFNKK